VGLLVVQLHVLDRLGEHLQHHKLHVLGGVLEQTGFLLDQVIDGETLAVLLFLDFFLLHLVAVEFVGHGLQDVLAGTERVLTVVFEALDLGVAWGELDDVLHRPHVNQLEDADPRGPNESAPLDCIQLYRVFDVPDVFFVDVGLLQKLFLDVFLSVVQIV